ncbi:MAG: hypothetical protein E6H50_00830 [Betaproteobacteria bacterium]|nr:MAG: hypothetical protein E6H50_00830 [Betaproteobacteria bacterium]
MRPTLLSARALRRLRNRIRSFRTEWTGWSGSCTPSDWPGNNTSWPLSHRRPMSAAVLNGAWIATVTAKPCRMPGLSWWSRSGTDVPSSSAPRSRDSARETSWATASCPGPSTARTPPPPEISPSARSRGGASFAPRGAIFASTRGVIASKKEMEMNGRRLHAASAVLAGSFMLGGCVSTGEYEKLEAEKNQEIAALQKQRGGLQEQVQGLQSQKTSLEQQQAELRRQIDALEQQKAQLLVATQQNTSQYDALVRNLTEEVKKGQLQVRQYKDMLTVDVAEQLFFDSGRASLKDTGKDVLKKVGEALKGYEDKVIRVVGHTDNVPISKAAQKVFPSNWELSVARATNVVHYLQEVGIPPERMIASGRAEYQPVAENDTPEGRKKNRRIEITLIDKNLVQEAGPGRK